jgi:hypothetical protein
MSARITNYGAFLVSLTVPDKKRQDGGCGVGL